MRINRFYFKFETGGVVREITEAEIVNQIKNVLRLNVGQEIVLFNGEGEEIQVAIVDLPKDKIMVEIVERREIESQIGNRVTLYCAILKKENFELVVQKVTEIGVVKIVPIITDRTIKLGLNQERLHKIAREAVEQSGRADLPEISEPVTFEKALELAKENDANIFFNQDGSVIKSNIKFAGNIGIFIGPEGGWTDEEVKKAKAEKIKIMSFGPLVYRAETAAIVASYLAVNF